MLCSIHFVNKVVKYQYNFFFLTGALFISGTLLFCGSCYSFGLTGDKKLNKFAPTGGMMLIGAWMSMIL